MKCTNDTHYTNGSIRRPEIHASSFQHRIHTLRTNGNSWFYYLFGDESFIIRCSTDTLIAPTRTVISSLFSYASWIHCAAAFTSPQTSGPTTTRVFCSAFGCLCYCQVRLYAHCITVILSMRLVVVGLPFLAPPLAWDWLLRFTFKSIYPLLQSIFLTPSF
jgi:hypothetical protein